WQYSLFVPQDVAALIDLHGGPEGFEKHLDELFTANSATTGRDQADITGLIGQYAHGNEPSHHMAYLYNYIRKPWKTQQRVRQIMDEMYQDAPDGLSGNEDCGQMSAWYVMSALGFYPVAPGSPDYVIGSPRFPKATIHLESGKTFTIIAKNNSSENIYVRQIKLNGKPHPPTFITHDEIMNGGTLEFEMGPEPNEGMQQTPPTTYGTGPQIAAVPWLEAESQTFTDQMSVKIRHFDPQIRLHFTTDGSEPTTASPVYTEPLQIDQTTTIRAMAATVQGVKSFPVRGEYYKIDGSRSIQLKAEYANQYAAGGDKALIDYLEGGLNFRTGRWQGFREDLEATVDLGSVKDFSTVKVGFLQDQRSWIWLPTEMKVAFSEDGKNFGDWAVVKHNVPLDTDQSVREEMTHSGSFKARYVKVFAKQLGVCPEWHLGAGGKTWIFADEIR
ncbi:MAG: GH92 family glycosyl hydrolase, partial [Bacteroidota bacterium]